MHIFFTHKKVQTKPSTCTWRDFFETPVSCDHPRIKKNEPWGTLKLDLVKLKHGLSFIPSRSLTARPLKNDACKTSLSFWDGIWMFPKIVVPPKSSILGYHYFRKPPYDQGELLNFQGISIMVLSFFTSSSDHRAKSEIPSSSHDLGAPGGFVHEKAHVLWRKIGYQWYKIYIYI